MQAYFASFARYNRWANARLYEAAVTLTDAQYRADRGVFFRSMHGTLNHLLVTDRIWMQRLTGAGEAPGSLDAILFEDLGTLRAARDAEDSRIIAYVDGLTETALAGTIRYRRVTTPEMQEAGLVPTLAHLFNHQTHHRGQAHAILTGLTGRAPELDLVLYQRLAAA
jgi:uncharacterized damage-inducible protein DinB